MMKKDTMNDETTNPFVHQLKLTTLQTVQVFLMSLTIAPIKMIFTIISLALTWFLALVFTIGDPIQENQMHYVGPFRKKLYQIFRYVGRMDLFFMGLHCINVKGKRASANDAPILVAVPHSSMLDIFIWFVSDPMPTAVSKYENFETPIFGTLLKAIQPILVKREDRKSRKNSVQFLKQRMVMPNMWPQMIVFPEGTCTNSRSLIQFKAGAFLPGVPVQPVVLRYLNQMNSFTWTECGPGGLTLMWLTLCQFYVKAEIEYLPVFVPNILEQADAEMYATNVRLSISNCLGIPCSEYSIEDWQLMRYALRFNFPPKNAVVAFSSVSKKFKLNYSSVKERFSEYATVVKAKGLMSVEMFARLLNLSVSPTVQLLFRMYDTENSGLITFKQYIMGFYGVSLPAVTENWDGTMNLIKKRCFLTKCLNDFEKSIFARLTLCDNRTDNYTSMCNRPELAKLLYILESSETVPV